MAKAKQTFEVHIDNGRTRVHSGTKRAVAEQRYREYVDYSQGSINIPSYNNTSVRLTCDGELVWEYTPEESEEPAGAPFEVYFGTRAFWTNDVVSAVAQFRKYVTESRGTSVTLTFNAAKAEMAIDTDTPEVRG